MAVSSEILLDILPPFNNNSVVIEKNQGVHDIIKEVLNAHRYFGHDYDYIFQFFDIGSISTICKNLFNFCKDNISYKIESEDRQTTKSPAAIISTGNGDCKHYAGFIAGVLSAITRNTGRKINWCYRFASYSIFDEEPAHVFVVVKSDSEIWIDPVLCCFNTRTPAPTHFIDKKINNALMLTRLSGVEQLQQSFDVNYGSSYLQDNAVTQNVSLPVDIVEDDTYTDVVPPEVVENIKMLLYYGVIDDTLNINSETYLTVLAQLPTDDANELSQAYGSFMNQVQGVAAIGDIFGDIWGAVKQVSLAIPRGAYLSLVSLNVFNLAGHLNKCITTATGATDQPGIDKLQGVWHGKLRGDTNILLRAIRNGAHKPAILGAATMGVVAAAAWAATAAVIITAMTPIIKSIMGSKGQLDAMAMQQLNMQPMAATGTGTTTQTLQKYLPFLLIGGVGLYLYFDSNKRR